MGSPSHLGRTALVPNGTHGIPIKGFSASGTRLVSIEQQTLLRVELTLLKVRAKAQKVIVPNPNCLLKLYGGADGERRIADAYLEPIWPMSAYRIKADLVRIRRHFRVWQLRDV